MLAAVVLFRLAGALVVSHPGYTDAYYYFEAAQRLARGEGLSVDFVWNFLEAPGFPALPIPSHRFWMPLASALQAGAIATLGGLIGAFGAAQAATSLVALAIPLVAYLAARRLGAAAELAALAGFIAGLGGAYAAAWSSLDNFAPVALLGTVLLSSLDGAARGARREVVAVGLALGGLALARADGALYALAFLVFPRRASLAAAALAVAVAAPWYARDLLLGAPEGQLARTLFLVRYEDFFRLAPPDPARYLAAWPAALGEKLAAAGTTAGTFLLATLVLLGPLALWWAWRARQRATARGWLVVAVALWLAQSLAFTLHSTRGSFSHSFAGLMPMAVVLGLQGGAALLVSASPGARRAAGLALAAGALAVSVFALALWRESFDPPLADRRAIVATGSVATPALVVDAAAWRAVLDGPTLVTPADGVEAAREVARRYGARTLVLERSHFSAYDALYDGQQRLAWLELVASERGIVVWRILP